MPVELTQVQLVVVVVVGVRRSTHVEVVILLVVLVLLTCKTVLRLNTCFCKSMCFPTLVLQQSAIVSNHKR